MASVEAHADSLNQTFSNDGGFIANPLSAASTNRALRVNPWASPGHEAQIATHNAPLPTWWTLRPPYSTVITPIRPNIFYIGRPNRQISTAFEFEVSPFGLI